MKKIFITILLLLHSHASLALGDKDINISSGFGAFGSRGLFGASVDRFINQNHAMSFAVGLDFVGVVSSVGYKYFYGNINHSNGKCFFFFDCDIHPYIGGSFQYAGKTTVEIKTASGEERDYVTDPKLIGLVNTGYRQVFKNYLTFDFEVSYRNMLAGGGTIQVAGAPADDRHDIERGYRAIGLNVGLGFLF